MAHQQLHSHGLENQTDPQCRCGHLRHCLVALRFWGNWPNRGYFSSSCAVKEQYRLNKLYFKEPLFPRVFLNISEVHDKILLDARVSRPGLLVFHTKI